MGNKDGDKMKRKSFGKWAIVALLVVAVLFSFTVCSKKADKTATTTTPATTAPATTAPVTTAQVQEEKKAETPVVTTPEPAPVVVEPVV